MNTVKALFPRKLNPDIQEGDGVHVYDEYIIVTGDYKVVSKYMRSLRNGCIA